MARSLPQQSALWSTLFFVGIGAALAGFGTALLALTFVLTLPSIQGADMRWPDVGLVSLASALASLLIGPLLWWCFIIRPRRLTLGRGILVGMLGSLLAHPLAWFLAILVVSLRGATTVLFFLIPSSNPIEKLMESLSISGVSLLYVGWLTTLVGGVVGGLLVGVQRHFIARHAGS